MTEKMKFKLVDAGCTDKDYRSRFISTDGLVSVTLKWSPDKSYYRVYPVLHDKSDNLWASPSIRINREFVGIKTPMELESLVAERMAGASIDGEDNDFIINWNGVPAFRMRTPGHVSVCRVTTVYKDDIINEFVIDTRTIERTGEFTGTIVDYNPRNTELINVVQVDAQKFIGSTVETE